MNEPDLFSAAIAISDPKARAVLLDHACANDPEQRARLAALIEAHFQSAGPLDRPPLECTVTAAPQALDFAAILGTPHEGVVIAGRYKLIERIGEGGMGSVWMAEQVAPVKRKVAVKVIKAGMDSKSVLARFEAERQALALMDHPNIAKVLDGGITEQGRPYFVMEYVKGVPITEYCDSLRLSVSQRLELFVQVCQAAQHAHQKGIIHRDLKPSNILVAPYDDRPMPKVIDFGLAKAVNQPLTDLTLHTAHEAVLGTPLYMSPEQAKLNNLDVDTRTDIYSLGVVLYELLTGTTPLERKRLRAAAWEEIRRVIAEEEPPRPSVRLSSIETLPSLAASRKSEPAALARAVRGDLDWIVMKALEKDRARRYETASGLAADLIRYLGGDAVLAAPPSGAYRMRKFVRKHRSVVTTALAFLFILTGAAVISLWQAVAATHARNLELEARRAADAAAIREREAKEEALAARDRAGNIAYLSTISLAQNEWNQGNAARARFLLATTKPSQPGEPDYRRFESYYLERAMQESLWTESLAPYLTANLALAPRLEWMAVSRDTVNATGDVAILDIRSHKLIRQIAAARSTNSRIALHPSGDVLATFSADGQIVLWDPRTGREIRRLIGHSPREASIAFSRDGKTMVTSAVFSDQTQSRSEIKVWRLPAYEPISTVSLDFPCQGLDVSPDGQKLVAAGRGIEVWETARGKRIWQQSIENHMSTAAFSPDGKSVAGSTDNLAWLGIWDATTGVRKTTLTGQHGTIRKIAYSHDGKRLASASSDGMIRVWDTTLTDEPPAELRGHESGVWDLAFAAEDARLASASLLDGELYLWDTDQKQGGLEMWLPEPFRKYPGMCVAFDRSGGKVATGYMGGTFQVCDARTGKTLFRRTDKRMGGRNWVAFSPTEDLLATLEVDHSVVLLKSGTGEFVRKFENSTATGNNGLFTADGRYLLTTDMGPAGTNIRIWDVRSGKRAGELVGHTEPIFCLAVSPDGKTVASGGLDKTVRIWDLPTRKVRRIHLQDGKGIGAIAFQPDGKAIASASLTSLPSSTIQIWEVGTGRPIAELGGRISYPRRLEFLPKGDRLAALGDDGVLRLWDLATGREALNLRVHNQGLGLAVSRDGRRIATSGIEGKTLVLDGRPLAETE